MDYQYAETGAAMATVKAGFPTGVVKSVYL